MQKAIIIGIVSGFSLFVGLLSGCSPKTKTLNPTAWDSFRDLTWGMSLDEAKKKGVTHKISENDDITPANSPDTWVTYLRENEKEVIGEVKISELQYGFAEDRLGTVYFQFDWKDSNDLVDIFSAKYGKPKSEKTEERKYSYEWRGMNSKGELLWISMHVNCNTDIGVYSYVSFNYKPVFDKLDKAADQIESDHLKGVVSKGLKDL